MLGALYGDVIGSYYENHCTKTTDFSLHKDSTFTDDTVLTVATCQAILDDDAPISRWRIGPRAFAYAARYKQFYARYPDAGFGRLFSSWARDPAFRVVRSYGNGAAMRAVPIGYAYDSIEQVLLQAKASCLYTHRHAEAVKAAQAVAAAVFLAAQGESKDAIRAYLQKRCGYDLSARLHDIRKTHVFDSRSAYSVPPAVIAFLEADDYESAVRNAVSLGGDADTQACIAGGIAQAYYKSIPPHIVQFCERRIDLPLRQTARAFTERFCPEQI